VTGAKITLRAQVCYWVSAALLSAFFLGKGLIALDLLDHSRASEVLDFIIILVMAPFGHYYVM